MPFNNILCVCTGNICRSPLAEGLLRQAFPRATVASAGIAAVEGGRMPAEAEAIVIREELPLLDHRGRQITAPMVNAADVILVMEQGQLEWVCNRFPQAKGRTFTLTHWESGTDIVDPYKKSQSFFEEVFDDIRHHTMQWAQRLGAMVSA
ncbi:low molecular weight protein-tyrosine-phosphatase [Salinisphaera sp.]|uniref:low molecular weight protein-tyrosine-phosphatase n=1 Tax=Salinisphaera sp. TaxID=1914330 RepID=UPI000C5DD9DF|nr:low molecular weight protein-tyrosine-phosphatase [Salinisphaera sp.]MAS08601.1 protein tyrosine phosphatase [Salinisphaera sp.]